MIYEKLHLKEFFPSLGENGCDPVLEVYLPENKAETGRENDLRPCMLVCPGGAYAFVSRREAEAVALPFLSQGFNAFVLTYSVAPHRFPTQLREVAGAVELIHQNARQWNCDRDRIALMGFSAGGHLAVHYCTSYDCPQVRELFPNSHPVQAGILCYPVITAQPAFAHMGSFENLTGHSPITQEDASDFSLENRVTEHTPPTFLWHTAEDAGVPVANSLLYAAALSRNHVPFELHVYPFGGHGLATADDQTCCDLPARCAHVHSWMEAAGKWLKLIFGKVMQTRKADEPWN